RGDRNVGNVVGITVKQYARHDYDKRSQHEAHAGLRDQCWNARVGHHCSFPSASSGNAALISSTSLSACLRKGRMNGLLARWISLSSRSTVWSINRYVRRCWAEGSWIQNKTMPI